MNHSSKGDIEKGYTVPAHVDLRRERTVDLDCPK